MSDLAVVYLPAGRISHHLPLPPGDDGQPLSVPDWLTLLIPEGTGEVTWAIVHDPVTMTGPEVPPPDASTITR